MQASWLQNGHLLKAEMNHDWNYGPVFQLSCEGRGQTLLHPEVNRQQPGTKRTVTRSFFLCNVPKGGHMITAAFMLQVIIYGMEVKLQSP